MAKKKSTVTADLFAKTTPPQQPAEDEASDKVKPLSVSLRESEYAEFDAIAAELNITRMAAMNAALRDFLKRYKAGKVKPVVTIEKGRVVVTIN